ncbi:MAG TPA: preprotein translocase subunit YajC [Gemmatimonadales bacterium]
MIGPTLLFVLFAPSGGTGGGGFGILFFQMAAFAAIIYFLMIRPKVQQEKRHRERIAQIKRGDAVVTAGGIMGTVVHVKENELTIKSGESRLIVHRDRVSDVTSDVGTDSAK